MKNSGSKSVSFIDLIQEWFRKRSRFWTFISLSSLTSVIVLQLFLVLQSEINPDIRQGIDSILVPLLALFVFSIFWRGSIPTFLSLAGAMSVYAGMFYFYAKVASLQTLPTTLAHKYKAGDVDTLALLASVPSVGTFYFLVGMLALFLSLAIALKPSLFHAKGTRFRQPYPVWASEDHLTSSSTVNARQMVPVMGLLSFAEHHLVGKYKYILVIVGGKTYFVSPYDWVPEGSIVIRDKESGSLLGVPEVSDGFNVW